jgi:4-amino-4-deoxy-L-arabinose transferase-like glycosyltransferase
MTKAGEERRGGPSNREDALLFLGIAAFAFLLRFVHLLEARAVPIFDTAFMDGRSYSTWADRIAAGDWIGDRVFYQAPLYPYFLAVLKLAVGDDLWRIRLVQIAIGSLACGILFLAGKRFFGRATGVVAGLLLALYPAAIFFDGLIQKANLGLLWTVLLLAALARARELPNGKRFALVGVPLGLLMLTREETVLLVPVLLLWSLAATRAEPAIRRVGAASSFLAGLAVVLLPVLVRNAVVGGEFALTTSQAGSNFYIGNNPTSNGGYVPLVPGRQNTEFERKDAFEIAERESGRKLSPGEVSRFWFGKSFAWIGAHPADWLRLLGTKVALLVNWYEMPDYEDQYFYERYCGLLRALDSFWHYGVLLPIAVAGLVLTFARRREILVLHLVLATLALGVVLFYVFARYRYPVVPVLVLFAAAALVQATALLRARRGSALVPAAIALGFAALASNWRIRDRDAELATSLSHAGSIADEKHDEAHAIEYYRQSLELRPDAPEILGNLGNALMRERRYPEGIDAYRRAAEIRPADWRAWMRLGAALEQAGRIDEAEPFVVRALDTDAQRTLESATELVRQTRGRDLVALDLCAAAQAAVGKFEDAVATATRAAALAPPAGQEALAARIRERLEGYREGRKLGSKSNERR